MKNFYYIMDNDRYINKYFYIQLQNFNIIITKIEVSYVLSSILGTYIWYPNEKDGHNI